MGVDIHMSIFKKGECIAEDIFDGRNSEWFDDLQRCGNNDVYNFLPIKYGISDQTSNEWKEQYNENEFTYYGFHYFDVKSYVEWFSKHNPHLDAGWVNTYDKWRYETQGIVPEVEHKRSWLEEDDAYFIVIEKVYDCSKWLFDYIWENNIPEDAVIQYCFDC